MKQKFLAAIHSKNKILISFYSKDDLNVIKRVCAPMDFGPCKRIHDQSDRFHIFDFDSDTKPHPLFLLPSAIKSIEVQDDQFDPTDFVTWDLTKTPWIIKRDWGRVS